MSAKVNEFWPRDALATMQVMVDRAALHLHFEATERGGDRHGSWVWEYVRSGEHDDARTILTVAVTPLDAAFTKVLGEIWLVVTDQRLFRRERIASAEMRGTSAEMSLARLAEDLVPALEQHQFCLHEQRLTESAPLHAYDFPQRHQPAEGEVGRRVI